MKSECSAHNMFPLPSSGSKTRLSFSLLTFFEPYFTMTSLLLSPYLDSFQEVNYFSVVVILTLVLYLIELTFVLVVISGISTLAKTPTQASDYLHPLLSFAAAHVPQDKHKETPLYILCTAGMRLLPER